MGQQSEYLAQLSCSLYLPPACWSHIPSQLQQQYLLPPHSRHPSLTPTQLPSPQPYPNPSLARNVRMNKVISSRYNQMKSSMDSHIVESVHQQALKDHLAQLLEETNEQVLHKLKLQNEKKAKIDALEKVFVEWADKKDNEIKQKIEKHTKNKDEHLTKIVKKCQDHEKYLQQKLKNHESKRKEELKAAWKQSNEIQQSIENYHISKHMSKDRTANRSLKESEVVSHSRAAYRGYDTQPRHTLSISKENTRQTKGETRHFLTEGDEQHEDRIRLPVEVRLKETFARFRQHVEKEEKGRIQQLGQKLERFEKFKMKKIEQSKQKKEGLNTLEHSKVERREHTPKAKGERVHSESTMHAKRTRDWSQANRQKRQQSLLVQLQNGTQYLQSRKMKYMKTHLSKKIALSAIEKKLYMERLAH